jgi:ribonuclease HI
MALSIFVDGSGGTNSGFGYFVKETGESFYEKKPDITNNQAEYMAIISTLKKF